MTPNLQTSIPDTQHALKELFWRRGYEHASIDDVVNETGLNRYALYNAYGGKLELFLAALDAYYQERKNLFLRNLNDPETAPLDAVRRVFEFAITEMAERGTGCLMCNVATEECGRDPKVAARVESYLDEIRRAYTDALERAAARDELNNSVKPADGAALLIAVKLGLGVHAKNGADASTMLSIFNTAMTALSADSS
ncbi:MAG: TetR/AcrR family transcriptional regulator [Pseudomonadota bacterium]